jgi:hypothetical protein
MRSSGFTLKRLVASALLVSTTGCYTTIPLGTTVPAPATRVVAALTDSGTVAMGGAIGTGALAIEGVVAAADVSAWDVELLRVDHRGDTSIRWNREVVRFPRSALADPAAKRLDRKRSWVAAILVGIAAGAAAGWFALTGAEEQIPPVGPVPQS